MTLVALRGPTVIVTPERALQLGAASVGGKAHALASLAAAGEHVPEWIVIPADALITQLSDNHLLADAEQELAGLVLLRSDESTREAVRRVSSTLQEMVASVSSCLDITELTTSITDAIGDGPFAVRSSAVGEDGEALSFAGQFDTVLNVEAADLADAVCRCWASAFSERALEYRRRAHALGDALRVGVIVQRMISGEISGVTFTADPVTGDQSRIRVSACTGLGDALVSGAADADEYLLRESGTVIDARPVSGAPLLDDAMLRKLATTGRRIAKAQGGPRDIEWTIRHGEIFILQSRPITSLTPKTEKHAHRIVWDNSNIQESYNGVTTPLTFSFASAAYASVYEQTMRVVGLSERVIAGHRPVLRTLLGLIRGRVYYNLNSWYRGLLLLPSFRTNKSDMERMMGVEEPVDFVDDLSPSTLESLRRVPGVLRAAAGLLFAFARLDRRIPRFLNEINASIAEVDRASLDRCSLDELMDMLDMLWTRCIERWATPIVNDFRVMMATGRLRRIVERANPSRADALMQEVLGGADVQVSAGLAIAMLRLSQYARTDIKTADALRSLEGEDALQAASEANAKFAATFDDMIRTYGDRCMGELKLESRPLRDDPAFIVRMLRNYLAGETQDPEWLAEAAVIRRARAEREVSARLSMVQRVYFRLMLGLARRSICAREEMRLARTQLFGAHRDIYRSIGRRYHASGTLNRPDDVFYLTREEIRGYWEGTSSSVDLAAVANARRAEFARYELQDAPNRIVTTGAPYEELNALERHEPVAAQISSDGILCGLGCSAGVAEGRVRIVRCPDDNLALDGHILVAPRTDPGWAPLFPSARAIIVERGSLLSHSAVLARELGIPAVVGIAGVVDLLRDGELVRVDGTTGTIQLLERP